MNNPNKRHNIICALLLPISLLLLLVGCQAAQKRIVLRVDGHEQLVLTGAGTVRELLQEQGILLHELDRVEPASWTELGRSGMVRVIRIHEESSYQPIPFTRQVIKDETLPEGSMRLLQDGQAGATELVYRISRDGAELNRQLIAQTVITPPRPEIMAVGVGITQDPVAITGTLAYLANGNGWVIRHSSDEKRPVTFDGQLDGRVFALDHAGERLLFTKLREGDAFNGLFMVDTRVLHEEPISLNITNVIYAEWAPDNTQFAYSTAAMTEQSPGWTAHNDLWLASATGVTRTQVISSISSIYGWWGANWSWNPTGTLMAYATPETIGIVDMATRQPSPLLSFPAFHTFGEWVWVPSLAWSPEGRYLACVVHSVETHSNGAPNESRFDLWMLDIQAPLGLALANNVGMWSNPAWSTGWRDQYGSIHYPLAYGTVQLGHSAATSTYDIHVMDRDGSNKRQALPQGNETGLRNVEIAWAPNLPQFAYIQQGDLYLLDLASFRSYALTHGSQCERVTWRP